jgi:hypothetical protein
VQIAFRPARTTPTITQEQRLAWLKELLTGEAESLPYRPMPPPPLTAAA